MSADRFPFVSTLKFFPSTLSVSLPPAKLAPTLSAASAAVDAIEAIDPAATGYLGGLGLPIVLGWAVEQYEALKTGPVLVYVLRDLRDRALELLADYGVVVIHPAAKAALIDAGAREGAEANRLRLPRALAAFAVGGLLALAGALIQVLLRNPLGDPYVLGVSGGASAADGRAPPLQERKLGTSSGRSPRPIRATSSTRASSESTLGVPPPR